MQQPFDTKTKKIIQEAFQDYISDVESAVDKAYDLLLKFENDLKKQKQFDNILKRLEQHDFLLMQLKTKYFNILENLNTTTNKDFISHSSVLLLELGKFITSDVEDLLISVQKSKGILNHPLYSKDKIVIQ
jgi:hypothetical protein